MDSETRKNYRIGLDSQLLKFVRILGRRTPYFSTDTVRRINGIEHRHAVMVIDRGLTLGVMKRREGRPGSFQLASYDVSHTSKG
ncbi:hypothetical protein [Sansalvadorimonas verongulae]|uniref:hypothetical protein n=1 Tax=Sansalvadorimonas verongulae TaxID=2172824 RepID=UPI0012BBB5CB|nr:hypothetical protein [Sansalvadorimonas verongulae]MTI12420.1 hypothetical protein [Sansalvadorimonas verongulae]